MNDGNIRWTLEQRLRKRQAGSRAHSYATRWGYAPEEEGST